MFGLNCKFGRGMNLAGIEQFHWLDRLGYAQEPRALHLRETDISARHPYALEVRSLLHSTDSIRAQAVFDVDGVPTVVFVGEDEQPISKEDLDRMRQKIWNQNLASVVIEMAGNEAHVFPARKLPEVKVIRLDEARTDGPFSALDVTFSNTARRHPNWFDVEARVDRKLLENLSATVSNLTECGLFGGSGAASLQASAELLMGQVLFVSYLEHRNIVGGGYRERRSVGSLHDLVAANDTGGILKLVGSLRQDFNGDFLGDDSHDPWSMLNKEGFDLLDRFLSRTDMATGQEDFWNYDFSCIPVELLSGLYESFLSRDQQEQDSAYYTPRHLAVMAVDQALAASADSLSETVFDGACGSGILLTTAYRRLIAMAETREGRQLGFKERGILLKDSIFGADINPMACRVTAFSLYLSLLEGLDPADILEAQEREDARLPNLMGTNLYHGRQADFFSSGHGLSGHKFRFVISNPPWKEPGGDEETSADGWANGSRVPFVRRQIAGAYALRALEFLAEGGHLCLILPISLFLAPTSSRFVSHFFQRVQPKRIINFGDLQNILFSKTEHTCNIFLGVNREGGKNGRIAFDETFDYCVPKADMSLSYGRLTVQSTDRHALQTKAVAQEPHLLVALMWGDAQDLKLLTELGTLGTFGDFCRKGRDGRGWLARKGIHLTDRSRDPVSSDPLRALPHVHATFLRGGAPAISTDMIGEWPEDKQQVVGLNGDVWRIFEGPRILFPDGFSRQELTIRAYYVDVRATFTVSVGVVAGPESDKSLLKFAAAYLRSDLARYFMMMSAWKMLCERNAIHLRDIKNLPFFDVKNAPDPIAAQGAVDRVVAKMNEFAQLNSFEQEREYQGSRDELESDVFEYFGISDQDRALVKETVRVLLPSVRPRNFGRLNTRAQERADRREMEIYAGALADALTVWRKRTGGAGAFGVSIAANDKDRAGAVGAVRIEYLPNEEVSRATAARIDDEFVRSTIGRLRRYGLTLVPLGDVLHFAPDVHVWTNEALYLVRPLMRRLWTRRQALRDAEHIVRAVQNRRGPLTDLEAA